MKRFYKRGFSMVELIIVIAILGALTAIFLPTYVSYVQKAKKTACLTTVQAVNDAVFQVKLMESGQPDDAHLLQFLVDQNILSALPACPAGGSYVCHDYWFTCAEHTEDGGENPALPGGTVDISASILAEIEALYGDTSYSSMVRYLQANGYPDANRGVNEAFRALVYQKNNGWDTFETGGKQWHVQPMLNTVGNGDITSDRIIYFANERSDCTNNWKPSYVYDKTHGVWYQCKATNYTLAGKTWADIKADMTNNPQLWVAAPDITVKPTP